MTSPPVAVDPRRAVAALILLSFSTFVFVTAESLPIGLLTLISPSLHVSYARVGLLVTGYGAVVALTSVPLTRLTMRLSRRRLLCGAFAVFSVSTLACALAPTYGVLLGARVVAALSHAVFWSVVATTATELFARSGQGRVVAALFTGSSLGFVLGVPAATWVGQHHGWRSAFFALAVLGAGILVGLAALLPETRRQDDRTATGANPDAVVYRTVLATTGLSIAGLFAAQTYVTLFLERASGFAASSFGPTLLMGGVGGLLGVVLAGWAVARFPRGAIVAPLVLAGLALALAYPLAANGPATVALIILRGLATSAYATAAQVRILAVAPGSTDLASAGNSAMFNVGIGGGALIGAGVVAELGVRQTPVAAACLTGLALVVFALGTRTPVTPSAPRR